MRANFDDINESDYMRFLEVRPQDVPVSGPVVCAEVRGFLDICGVDEKFAPLVMGIGHFVLATTLYLKA